MTAAPSSAALNAGDVVTLTLALSAPVQVTPGAGGVTPRLALSNGAFASYAAINPAGTELTFTYTVAAGQDTQALQVTNLDLNGATVESPGGLSFQAAQSYGAGDDPLSVAVADVDGDGDADLVAANAGSSNVSVLLGNGAGGFGTNTNFVTGSGPFSVAVADVSGDGNADLVTANVNGNTVSVLLGNGTGGFSPKTDFTTGSGPQSVAVADVSGDGNADLVTANNTSNTVSVLLGNGAGGFSAATDFKTGSGPSSVAVGDVNGDTKLDLVTANLFGNNVSVLLGNGAGGFGLPTDFTTGSGPQSVAVGDVSVDNKLDLVTANFFGNNVSVLLGNGAGGFGLPTDFAAGFVSFSVAVADVSGDSKLDLVTANTGDSTVSVLLGNGMLTATPLDASGLAALAGSSTGLVIDTTAPAIAAVAALPATATLGSGGTAALTLTTTEPVVVNTAGGAPTLLLSNGGVATFDAAASTPTALAFAYTAQAGQDTADLAVASLAPNGAIIRDAVGNNAVLSGAAANPGGTLRVDTTAPAAPAAPILAPGSDSGVAGDRRTNVTRPALAGAAEAGSTVTVSDGAVVLGTTLANMAGVWSFTPGTALANGAHSITARATDAAGNASAASAALALTVDNVAPVSPVSLALTPGSDSGAAGDNRTNVAAPTLTGAAEAGSTVTVFDGAVVLGTTLANTAGVWSLTPGAALADGAHSITATAMDAAGNTSAASAALALTVDGIAPAAPVSLVLSPGSDSGVAGDSVTNVTRPAFAGTAEAGSTVTLLDGAAVLGTAVADGAGQWSFTPVTALAEGAHSLTARATDAASNASVTSAALALVVDTTAPPAPASLALASASDSGIAGDGLTSDATPTLTGAADPGSTVTLTDTGEGTTLVLGTTQANAAGGWSFTPGTALANGARSITATATDAAGNASAASAAPALTVDTVAPAAPGSLTLTVGSDSGAAGDNRTNVAAPTLAGTAEAGSTVALFNGATALGTAVTDGAGQWSFTPAALADGAYSFTARATDAAGNASPASAALALVVDTTAPVVTQALAQDTGLDYDGVTSDPTLTGTADPGDAVTLAENGAVLGTAVADAAGAWRFTPVGLADGAHTIIASNTDAAGNTGQAAVSFVLDTAPPTTDVTVVDSSGVQSEGVLTPFGQGASGVARGFTYGGTSGVTIVARADNAQLRGGGGGDAIVARGGRSVLDGGGSDWLVGGTGQNSFVVDARGGTWNTVLNFNAGDDIAVRGIQEVASIFRWIGLAGAAGYQGATLRGTPDNTGEAFSLTFSGLTIEDAKRYSAVVEREADGTSVLRMRAASPSAPEDASFAITDVTTGVVGVRLLDVYQGPLPGLRYQHVQADDAPAVLLARASDSLLRSGAGNDALAVRNGDNVLDAGAGSNWLVGGAGDDTFVVDARGGLSWNTVVNFHAGDTLLVRGYEEGVSSWSWTAAAEGAAGYQGATLRAALDGGEAGFSLTLTGISVEEARGYVVSATTSDGVGALSIRA